MLALARLGLEELAPQMSTTLAQNSRRLHLELYCRCVVSLLTLHSDDTGYELLPTVSFPIYLHCEESLKFSNTTELRTVAADTNSHI